MKELFICPWCHREDVTFEEIKKHYGYVGLGNCNLCGSLASEPHARLKINKKQEDFLLEQARELDLKELKGGKNE